jgi:hypothetical protein
MEADKKECRKSSPIRSIPNSIANLYVQRSSLSHQRASQLAKPFSIKLHDLKELIVQQPASKDHCNII